MQAIQRKTLVYLKIKTNTKLLETNDTIICKIYFWYNSLNTLTKKSELTIVKLTDLHPLSCSKQKVMKHFAQDREAKSENDR